MFRPKTVVVAASCSGSVSPPGVKSVQRGCCVEKGNLETICAQLDFQIKQLSQIHITISLGTDQDS